MSFQFRLKANFQNFVQAIKPTNLQTHEPVNIKKTTKIEPHENKVFHSSYVFVHLKNLDIFPCNKRGENVRIF